MTKTQKIILSAIGLLLIGGLVYYNAAKANPSFFVNQTVTSASSTPKYQTAGTGTSTMVIDSFTGISQAIDSGVILVQQYGSSTVSKLAVNIEYSQDGIDYYTNYIGAVATTSSYIWSYASSSPIGGQAVNVLPAFYGNVSAFNRAIVVDMPTRFARIVITTPPGSLPNTFWYQFVGKRETRP